MPQATIHYIGSGLGLWDGFAIFAHPFDVELDRIPDLYLEQLLPELSRRSGHATRKVMEHTLSLSTKCCAGT